MNETKRFICPFCQQPVEVVTNMDIVEHLTIGTTCTSPQSYAGLDEKDVIQRLIKSGLINQSECFVSHKEKTSPKLII